MQEYKIITGTARELPKRLNQWRHQYYLNIIQMIYNNSSTANGKYTILLTRVKKEEYQNGC